MLRYMRRLDLRAAVNILTAASFTVLVDGIADDSQFPRFIETAHRRGYRFVGQTRASGQKTTAAADAISDRRPSSCL